jgi:hypothetical protein
MDFAAQWEILQSALDKHGPRVWAIAALQDIRHWTSESLVPLAASNVAVDQDAIVDLIRESMREALETKNEIFPIESVAGKPGTARKRRRSGTGRGSKRTKG